jgi:hypothetical protein
MTLTREKEIWAIALCVEKHHGNDGDLYVAQQMDRLVAEGELDGMAMWRQLAERFRRLKTGCDDHSEMPSN